MKNEDSVARSKNKKRKALYKYTAMAILTTVSLIFFTVEAALPPIPIQGVKVGFSNVVTLVAIFLLGKWEAFTILVMRIILASIFAGSVLSFGFSIAGGVMAFIIMAVTADLFGEKKIWITSVLGAVFHNAGQLAVAVAVTGTPRIFIYAPVLLLSAIVTGTIIGVVSSAILAGPLKRQ